MPSKPQQHRAQDAIRRVITPHAPERSTAAYDRTWQRFRRMALSSNPLCQDCPDTSKQPAREVHHIEKVKDNPARRLDATNVLCLCKSCHSKRTARGE